MRPSARHGSAMIVVSDVWVRKRLDQQAADLGAAVATSKMQRRTAFVALHEIGVGGKLEQHLGDPHQAVHRGQVQRRVLGGRAQVHVGAPLHEHPTHLCAGGLRRSHRRQMYGAVPLAVGVVDETEALGEQHRRALWLLGAHGGMQGQAAPSVGQVGEQIRVRHNGALDRAPRSDRSGGHVCPEQQPNATLVSVVRGEVQAGSGVEFWPSPCMRHGPSLEEHSQTILFAPSKHWIAAGECPRGPAAMPERPAAHRRAGRRAPPGRHGARGARRGSRRGHRPRPRATA
mmetsp:Transcript_95226/g.306857  ORF Transcript_95226/g.306857 Transcript_95226/m.306857 type:complete len:287 (+) Transcript_95226:482-1342(+)